MKIQGSLFLAALFLLPAIQSCKKDFISQQAPNALDGLADAGKEPLHNLDWLNEKQIAPGENAVEGDQLYFGGWAADPDAGKPASKVYLALDGKLFTTQYGAARDDVAGFFKNPAYRESGFYARIPRSALSPGVHSVGLKVVGADGKSVFSSAAERAVLVRL